MKRTLLIFSLLFSMFGSAQDWAPFKTTDTVKHYTSKIYQSLFQHGLFNSQMQSVVVNTKSADSTRTMVLFKKGYSLSNFDINGLQVIKSQVFGDTGFIYSDSTVFKTYDVNGWDLYFPHSFHQSGNFRFAIMDNGNYLIGSTDSLYEDTVNGVIDSLVLISLQAYNSLGQIDTLNYYHLSEVIMSKRNGMLKGYDFTNLSKKVLVNQFFSSIKVITNQINNELTVGDEYHVKWDTGGAFRAYYDVQVKIIADTVLSGIRTLTYRELSRKTLPPPAGNITVRQYTNSFRDQDTLAILESQIIEDSILLKTNFIYTFDANEFHTCTDCGFNDLSLKEGKSYTTYYNFFNSSVDSVASNNQWIGSNESSILIGVNDRNHIFSHNFFSSNSQIVYVRKGNQTWGTPLNLAVGLDDQITQDATIVLYPNPVKEALNVKSDQLVLSSVVRDIHGKTIAEFGRQKKLDISALSSGIYFLQIQTEKGVFTNKFLKE